jgi:hypothetical protein
VPVLAASSCPCSILAAFHVKIVPADFLIEIDGRVVDLWYGRDTADHIPLSKIQRFADNLSVVVSIKQLMELEFLRKENKKLKQMVQVLKIKAKEM